MATIDAYYFNVCVMGAQRRGLRPGELYRQVGIDERAIAQVGVRESAKKMAQLVALMARELDDHFLGYTESPVKPAAFALGCELALHGDSVLQGLQRRAEFYRVLGDQVQVDITRQAGQVSISCALKRPELDPCNYFMEFWLMSWHRLACWFAGDTVPILAAEFSFPQPQDHAEEFQRLFPCARQAFSRPRNRLVLPAENLLVPVRRTAQDLAKMLRRAPLDIMSLPGRDDSVARQVREVLSPWARGVYQSMSAAQVAAQLGISEVVMRRRLKAEHSSFTQLCEGIRRDLACAKLKGSQDSVERIAEDLGYMETRSFSRAFKTWVGLSPVQYRQSGHR